MQYWQYHRLRGLLALGTAYVDSIAMILSCYNRHERCDSTLTEKETQEIGIVCQHFSIWFS